MDLNLTLDDVLLTPRQRAVRDDLHKLLDELEAEYRQGDPKFSLSGLRAYMFTQDLDGINRMTINDEIDPELHRRLHFIAELVLGQK